MKKQFLLFVLLLKATALFSQSQFVIIGETNFITNGKAILTRNSPAYFYPDNYKDDTVTVHDHAFIFKGTLKYPAPFVMICLDENGKSVFSELFFVDIGNQKMAFDSSSVEHDPWSPGHGIQIEGSKANDEYVNTFLPLFNDVNKEMQAWVDQSRFNSIVDKQAKKDSIIITDIRHSRMKRSRDSILYNYADQHCGSPIIAALLYEAVLRHDYSDYFYKAFDKIRFYNPISVNSSLKAFLDVQKLKGVGNTFPLYDFIKANIDSKGKKAKYTLVDFWFAACGPCIFYFNSLRDTYKEFHDKGFNIVAISIDKKTALPERDRIINKFQYTWDQVLDQDGVKTKSLNIRQYPSTFLLDSQGKIIKTHIDPVMLNDFLEKNL